MFLCSICLLWHVKNHKIINIKQRECKLNILQGSNEFWMSNENKTWTKYLWFINFCKGAFLSVLISEVYQLTWIIVLDEDTYAVQLHISHSSHASWKSRRWSWGHACSFTFYFPHSYKIVSLVKRLFLLLWVHVTGNFTGCMVMCPHFLSP